MSWRIKRWPFAVGEFKKWRRARRRQRHKSMIWLVEWIKKVVLHVRHAFRCNFWRSLPNDDVKFLTTTRARSSKSFILGLYMNTIRARQAKVHFAYFVQRDQFGIIAKHLTLRKTYFNVIFSLQQPSYGSFFNSPIRSDNGPTLETSTSISL